MQKRKLKLIILTLIVASFLSSNTTVFAKSIKVEKSNGIISQEVKNPNKNLNKYSKKAEKEIKIISHRLDGIEVSLKSDLKKMDEYLNSRQPDTTTPDTTTPDTTTPGTTTPDTTTTDTTTTDTTTPGTTTTDTTTPDTTTPDTTTSGTTTPDTSSLNNTGSEDEEQESQAIEDKEDSEETEDLSDDFENEYKEEDNGRYNSFYGKLNSINNRLNTVERQLSKISDSGNLELVQLNSRVASLRDQVKTSMDSLAKVQKQRVDTIKTKLNKKQLKEQKISQDKKTWKIHFTKELKEETVNSKNIMIVDSNNNLVDASISYDKNSKNVVIETKDGFNKGETYFILIGDEVQSIKGEKLPKTVEKKFTVN